MAAAASSADDYHCCQCSNILIMQLFHELKQKFPAVPDRVVSDCIRQNCHDKRACEILLRRENHGYLMHSYPIALKMSTGEEEQHVLPDRQQCDRCCGKSYDEAMPKDATSVSRSAAAAGFYASVRETSHVLQNSNGKNNVNRSVVQQRDRVVESGAVITPDVVNVNERLSSPNNRVTGTQWFAQGSTTTQYRPPPPVSDSNARYNPSSRDNANVRYTQYPQFPDMTFTRGASQFQCVESQSTTNSSQYFSQVGAENNNSNSSSLKSSVVNNSGQCNRAPPPPQQQQQSSSPLKHTVASTSSLSVQSSTTFHKHCNRPCSLNVTSGNMLDQAHPRSAPELPSTFEPFSRLLQSRSIPFNTPTTPTTPSDNYPSYLANCDSTISTMSENNLNLPFGKSNNCPPDCEMNVNCSQNEAGSRDTSSATAYHRARSALSVEPAPHYASRNYWGGGGGTLAVSPSQQPRSYTSVNLTLRPPSLEPLPPIEIESAGTSLTYSTSSYDPRQGFQSQLQIRIGPGGVGSVSALRTRVPDERPRSWYMPDVETGGGNPVLRAESMPDVTALSLTTDDVTTTETSLREQIAALGGDQLHTRTRALLGQQLERKNRLRSELRREKQKLRDMHREVQLMAEDLAQRQLTHQRTINIALPVVTTVLQKVQSLRQEIQFLQKECKKMTTEVDLSSDDRGQEGRNVRAPPSPLEALDLDGPNWTCSECTFRNHPLLDKCEQCEMPRIILGTDSRVEHPVDCYCHPTDTLDKMLLPNPLIPLPRMITNTASNRQQSHI